MATSEGAMDPSKMTLDERKEFETFDLGNFSLIEGATLRGATLAYKAWGKLSGSKDNLIVYPTMYGGTHWDEDWMIGPGKALDTTKYFILVINMLGNGISSSPSNFPPPYNKARFPKIRYQDMVRAHHKLVTERFGCSKVQLVLGGSMGAGQTFQWAVSYPEMVERIAPWCGNAKCAPHNYVFLEGIKAALTADVAFKGGWYEEKPAVGLRAMARVWAGWGMSQQFYWQEAWRDMGFSSLEDFIVGAYEGSFLQGDPNDYLSMLWTWQHADIGLTEGLGGDYVKALESIEAKAIVMPGEMDLYFPVVDQEWEVRHMKNSDVELRVIPGIMGHAACGGERPEDAKFISDCVKELLSK